MPATSPPIALPVAAAVTSVLAAVLVPPAVPSAALAERWLRPVPGEVARTFHYSRGAPFTPGAHRGVDLAAPPGTAVRSACAGRVVHAGRVAGQGVVSVRCGARRVTHLPLRSIGVRAGARVRAGASIGTLAAGHGGLHLGVRAEDDPFGYVDPMTLLPGRGASPRAGRGTPAPRSPAHDPPAAARLVRVTARARRPGRSRAPRPAAARRAGGRRRRALAGVGGHGARGLRRRRVGLRRGPSPPACRRGPPRAADVEPALTDRVAARPRMARPGRNAAWRGKGPSCLNAAVRRSRAARGRGTAARTRRRRPTHAAPRGGRRTRLRR